MAITSAAWRTYLSGLSTTPTGSFDHEIADYLTTLDDASARDELVRMYVEDPPGTEPHRIAAEMLALHDAAVQA